MKARDHLISVLLLKWWALAQTPPTATRARDSAASDPDHVQAGLLVNGNYTGLLRPHVHFSPPSGFMNDPCGLFYDAGANTWHLYYQYNPNALVAGNQHWGHATSADLYHWINQPIALSPPEEHVFVFSGSAVQDPDNTSGFFGNKTNGVVAVFTLARYYADGTGGPQTQNVAFSRDGGYTFEMYGGNPVLEAPTRGSSQFRDPKVVRYDTDTWVMVVAFAQELTLGFWTSADLIHWTWASNFTHHGLLGAQWECPNLVQMPVRNGSGGAVVGAAWLLTISLQPGAPLGGSVTQYLPGDFNGTHFIPWDGAARLDDFAKDNYAGQFFSFAGKDDGRDAVSLSWASNWQYAQTVPTAREGWRSAMTLPRRKYLVNAERIGWTTMTEPVDPAPAVTGPLNTTCWSGDGFFESDFSAAGAVNVVISVRGLKAGVITSSSTLNVTFSSHSSQHSSAAGGQILRSGYYFKGDQPFWVDRSGSDALFEGNPFFTDKFSVADVWDTSTGTWLLQVVVDRTVAEFYVDGGKHVGTVLVYPDQPLRFVTVASDQLPGEVQISVAAYGLGSTWV